jgi:sugar phosphate isomerase/epimerase
MKINGFGKDVSGSYIDGHLGRLERFLEYIEKMGYDLAELPVTGLNIVANGHLITQRVEKIKEILSRYSLRYSVHAPNRTNLAFGYNHDLEKEVLRASVEFCYEIGAQRLVYHSGLQALDAAHTGMVALPDDDHLVRGAEQEVRALQGLAPIAAEANVVICMENGDTHLWEYGVVKQNMKPAEELVKYHPRLRIQPMIDQLQAINHPNVGMTLDMAHLHIAAHALGDDYLDAIELAAPWATHLHINDNFGKLDVGFDSETSRLPYGEADLHLPPGWGSIPFVEAFKRLKSYEGDMILEIKYQYWDHFGDALTNTRQFVAKSQ